jgi:hypothetical protein
VQHVHCLELADGRTGGVDGDLVLVVDLVLGDLLEGLEVAGCGPEGDGGRDAQVLAG